MIIQIYTAQSPREAVELAALGVDHVGLTPSSIGLPGEIDLATAPACAEALRGRATSVALSVSSDLEEIASVVGAVRPDIVHLCASPGAVPPAAVATLRKDLGHARIMQAIAMTGPEAVDAACAYASVADILILDSLAADVEGVGAAGTTHDWTVSAQIVEAVDIPVILAGGLAPDNVAAAIGAVKPWGVDSLTHTNRSVRGGGFVKDLGLVREFCRAAREAATSA